MLLVHLYRAEPETFSTVLVIAVVVAVELLYFERDRLVDGVEDGLRTVEERVESAG